jgi:hypothetical protein
MRLFKRINDIELKINKIQKDIDRLEINERRLWILEHPEKYKFNDKVSCVGNEINGDGIYKGVHSVSVPDKNNSYYYSRRDCLVELNGAIRVVDERLLEKIDKK